MAVSKFNHIFIDNHYYNSILYTSSGFPVKIQYPERNRIEHGKMLKNKFIKAWDALKEINKERTAVALPVKDGMYLEFKSMQDHALLTKSLEDLRQNVRICNIQDDNENMITTATVYLPAGKEKLILDKVISYLDPEKETPKGNPLNNDLIRSIEDIKLAVLESFWQDHLDDLPKEDKQWCEVWLRSNSSDENEGLSEFYNKCHKLQIEYRENHINFPERIVILINANRHNLTELIASCDYIAEYRKAKETAQFWTSESNYDQVKWVDELLTRVQIDKSSSQTSVCILDSGVNNGHRLLSPILHDDDRHAYNPTWGVDDSHHHGTLMAGLAGYGDIQKGMDANDPIDIFHHLESVKIIQKSIDNPKELYGDITRQAVSKAEIQAPYCNRVLCMAVTTNDELDQGRPSSWSGAVDQICFGKNDENKRLFIISAGNVDKQIDFKNYPDSNFTCSVQDPSQAWNALIVGAYTRLDTITDSTYNGCKPVAPRGGLSPFSTTSVNWRKWPVKPDVVFEGGNLLQDSSGFCSKCDDLSLLSTFHKITKNQFSNFDGTSAASAQVAWIAAQIMALYPNAWPETIRALIVHSASWTEQMFKQFVNDRNKKTEIKRLLQICGYGVPDLNKALYSAKDSLTLISQGEIQPYFKDGYRYKTKDMHIYELPWPKDILLSLGETEITVRITLSYFVEPAPGEIGWKDRYRYASFGFRFDINNSGETKEEFKKRINKKERDEDYSGGNSNSEKWFIGSNARDKGSIHSDIWEGTAAELSTCNLIGIYPVIGWWKERSNQHKYNQKARYSLIVSIETPEIEVDIYTPVKTAVDIKTKIVT